MNAADFHTGRLERHRKTRSNNDRIGPADYPIRCGTKARLESLPVEEIVNAAPRIDLSFTHLTIEATGFPIRALLLRGLVASTARLAAKYNRGLSPVAHLAMMHSERPVFQSVSLPRFCSAHRKTCLEQTLHQPCLLADQVRDQRGLTLAAMTYFARRPPGIQSSLLYTRLKRYNAGNEAGRINAATNAPARALFPKLP